MRRLVTQRRLPRWSSVALLTALLPMLTYFGHWEELGLTPHAHHHHTHEGAVAGAAGPGHHHDHAEHSRHCHIDLASCADIPLTALSGFALLADTLAVLGAAGHVIPDATTAEGVPRANVVRPAVPPPRA